jgi:predicted amino acid dehydrogenase
MDEQTVRSHNDACVSVLPILLPVTSRWIRRMFESRQRGVLRELVQRGVWLAESAGCQTAALGQFTSIVTRNGRSLTANRLRLVTGNSYTTSLIIEAVTARLSELQRPAHEQKVAIVGGGGNIGSACAAILARRFRQLTLVGSGKPSSLARLEAIARDCNATISTDPEDLRQADVVICATSAVDIVIPPQLIKKNAIVCDVSVPPAIAWWQRHRRRDLHWIAGGVVRLPHGERIKIPGFPLPAGHTYGCMAEALLLGFEADRRTSYVGPVQVPHVERLQKLAERHGFVHAIVRHGEHDAEREEISCAD